MSISEFDAVEGDYGSNIIFGDNKIYIWKSNQIYKYNAEKGQLEATYSTEFNYNNNEWKPYS